jgi:hypothetical protein
MTVAVGDVWQTIMEFQCGAEKGLLVRHHQVTVVNETSEELFGQALADRLEVIAGGISVSDMALDCFLVCATAQRKPPADPTRIYTTFGDGVKSILAAPNGAQNCLLFSTYADPGEEPVQGRAFTPFPPESISTDGQVDAAEEAGLFSAWRPLLLDALLLATEGTLIPALYRQTSPIAGIASAIVTLVLRPVIASQRRRVDHHQTFS